MKALKQKIAISALTLSQLLVAPCFSSIQPSARSIDLSVIQSYQHGQNFALIQPIESLRVIRGSDVSMIIPSDLKDGSSGSQVAMQILDHSLDSFFKIPMIAHSEFGSTAHKIENAMETNIKIGNKSQTQHNIKIQMQALQAKALVQYNGFVNAQVSYKAAQREFNIELAHPVALNTSLTFDHANLPNEQRSTVNLKLTF